MQSNISEDMWLDSDEMESADEKTDMDMQSETSGLDLIVRGESQHTLHNSTCNGPQSIGAEPKTKLQELIEERIKSARETVFNRMPIRLLKFDRHGKGITLVERSQVMECISVEIIAETTDGNATYNKTVFEEYAILSHTWLSKGEITYSDWADPIQAALIDTTSPGYNKLTKSCEAAANQGLRLAWMDTVCINKESSSELDESIRSMFKWYQNAKVCIVYLAETESLVDLKRDKWFTRGWTLQELLAPEWINFYSKHWEFLGAKNSSILQSTYSNPLISLEICAATGLEEQELSDFPYHIKFVPIWRKM